MSNLHNVKGLILLLVVGGKVLRVVLLAVKGPAVNGAVLEDARGYRSCGAGIVSGELG